MGQFSRGIGQLVGRVALRRGNAERGMESEQPEAPVSIDAPEDLENRIFDYILENGGSIALSKASEELGIPTDLITQAIERMTLDGRLKHNAAAEQAQENVIA